jgi:hypothetical protein
MRHGSSTDEARYKYSLLFAMVYQRNRRIVNAWKIFLARLSGRRKTFIKTFIPFRYSRTFECKLETRYLAIFKN